MSSVLSSKKAAENLALANEHYEKGKRKEGTTLLRWKPDWEQAARWYREAVKLYKLSGEGATTQLLRALQDSARAHREIASYHTAAADLEAAATLLRDKKQDPAGAAELFSESSLLYRMHEQGSAYDKCASTLVRAGECAAEAGDVARGVEFMKQACSVFEEGDRGVFHDATFKKAVSFCVAQRKFGSARSLLRRAIAIARQHLNPFEQDMYKSCLSIIVLRLHGGELDKAREELAEFDQIERFSRSDEGAAAAELIDAADEGDEERWAAVLKRNVFKYLANPIAVIARKLSMPEGGGGGGGGGRGGQAGEAGGAAEGEDEVDLR